MVDRATKLLLLLLVIGVWGVLLQTAFTTLPFRGTAGAAASVAGPGMVVSPWGVYLSNQNGTVMLLDHQLKLQAVAVQETDQRGRLRTKGTLVYVGVVLPWAGEIARTSHDVHVAATEDEIIDALMGLGWGFRQQGCEFYRPDLYAASGEVLGAFYSVRRL